MASVAPSAVEHLRSRQQLQSGSIPVDLTIGLSSRVVNVLEAAGITTFEELADSSDWELLQIPNLGYAALREIRTTLQRLGFTRLQAGGEEVAGHRTPLERELWELTAPAGGTVERGIAMLRFGWDGRLAVEEIRNRYRIRRERLRQIFLSVETQPVPAHDAVRALGVATAFLARHAPMWIQDGEALLLTAGLVRQRVTVGGLISACRIAAIDPGFDLIPTPRLLLIDRARVADCRAVIQTVQHLARIRGTTTIDEVRGCSEGVLRRPLDRKFIRRAIALIGELEWVDRRLGIVSIRSHAVRQ